MPFAVAASAGSGSGLVVFLASAEGGRAMAVPAEIGQDGRLFAPLQDGAAGGILLDRAGAVAGIVTTLAGGTRTVAGLVPPASHRFAGPAEIRMALGPHAPAPVADPNPSGLGSRAAALAPALVRVSCPPGGERAP